MNIAFGDYSGGIVGQESDDTVVREGIEVIHAKVNYETIFSPSFD